MSSVRSTDVACPKCGVPAGNWCIGIAGYVITNSHRERIADAREQATR